MKKWLTLLTRLMLALAPMAALAADTLSTPVITKHPEGVEAIYAESDSVWSKEFTHVNLSLGMGSPGESASAPPQTGDTTPIALHAALCLLAAATAILLQKRSCR